VLSVAAFFAAAGAEPAGAQQLSDRCPAHSSVCSWGSRFAKYVGGRSMRNCGVVWTAVLRCICSRR